MKREDMKLNSNDQGFYRFPAMAKLSEWNNRQQVNKLCDEASEVYIASYNLAVARVIDDQDTESYRQMYGEELMDVIHAAETALRMEFSDDEVAALRDFVEKKNRDRGYYKEDN